MKKLVSLFLGLILCLSVAGCDRIVTSDKAYPVAFDDFEITVGKTTVSELLDAGFSITEDGEEIPADTGVDKNSYYSGIRVNKGDLEYGTIDLMSKSNGTVSDTIIAKIMVRNTTDSAFDQIKLDGVSMSEVTPDVFAEHIAGSKNSDGTYGIASGTNYRVEGYFEDGKATGLNMVRRYNVQYGS